MALQQAEIGARIAELRKKRGSPPQDAVASKLEVSYRAYQAWEAGDTKPSYRNLEKLADFYGVSVEYILMGGDDGAESEPGQLDRIEAVLTQLVADQHAHELAQKALGESLAALALELAALRDAAPARRRRAS